MAKRRSPDDFVYFLTHTLIPDCKESGSDGWVETCQEARAHIVALQRKLKQAQAALERALP